MPQEPPYRRIAAVLRRRIESGELGPGDRIPSTREIARQWGVAMATATKVIAELRHEGLVRPVSGVGTVVGSAAGTRRPAPAAPPARSAPKAPGTTPGAPPVPGGAAAPLSRERIVATAIAVADAEGLEAVSMRRVANELEAATMSLYRHVADKDELLTLMMDAACSGWRFPADHPAGWRERLELAARLLWETFRRHPWLAPALSVTRPQLLTGALPFTEWVLQALDGRGLDGQTHFTIHITLFNYVRGTAINIEPEVVAEEFTGLTSDEWMDTQESQLREALSAGAFPTLERIAAAGYDFDLDMLFEFGLQRLLDGFAALVDGARHHRP
ncbi:TetR/AcrR family transcriptional regulator C-terminal domain-containing protein [Streptomyces sp. NBC_00102]|uniref:TetR/AcrR family transcriptional regulator C-terminal domain-containing protein n=1 Tax=Streptomyces sp. NBC_00102 TaxID=2975652 RepID=UPI0022524F56|nr:TetR/AcrR family transcriptional regulator C-terminal domain-containing protein [Streptomyces sp. NBC_00102]MCX5396667.1 TetR/AcrR family transcriptional regulator C-terminal domain-containing protein [Streptomyces sp. NBC_00102]